MKYKIKILFPILTSIIVGLLIAVLVNAWTNPSQAPSGGGGALYYSGGNVGIGTAAPGYTLTVNGTAWVTSGTWSGSDKRWKKNIKPLEKSLSKIMTIQGVNFDWRKEEYPDLFYRG